MLFSFYASWLISLSSLLAVIVFLCDKFYLSLNIAIVMIFSIVLSIVFHDPVTRFVGAMLFVIAEIDRREHRIPDVFTKPALFGLTIFFYDHYHLLLFSWGWIALMYLVTRVFPFALGRGDIKLVGVLLLLNGYMQIHEHGEFLVNLLFLSSALALPMAIAMRIRLGKKPFAFGPAIAGAWIWLIGSNLG